MKNAFVSEIYATVQGEGPFAGERQLFVRMAGCPLRCRYCDTPGSLTTDGATALTVDSLFEKIRDVARTDNIETVSFTGGEPLAQAALLADLFPKLKEEGFRIYLETAGMLPGALKKVIEWCDVVAMDLKFPSATGQEYWKAHETSLAIAGKKAFVKVICEGATTETEFRAAVDLAGACADQPLFVIQPVSPVSDSIMPITPDKIDVFVEIAKRRLPRVLVRTQQHRVWGVR